MKILYLGHSALSSTSRHRADALVRLGHEVRVCDPYMVVAGALRHPLWSVVHFRSGYRFLQRRMECWMRKILTEAPAPDLVWIDGGELLGPGCLRLCRALALPIVLMNVDDPTGRRDGHRFDMVVQSLPLYDLATTVRPETEAEMRKLGARRVLRVWRSYDEVMHAPFESVEDIPSTQRSEVAFIGTWMRNEGRDQFLVKLLDAGLPIAIWGDRWPKAPAWEQLRPHWRGGALGGRDYVGAIQGAKICLGMLSKGNRDLHTQRSLEVPYAGGLFCAERTAEHLELYREGEDAVFWSNAAECVQICRDLLADEPGRERMRRSGMRRVRELGVGNEDICRGILKAAQM